MLRTTQKGIIPLSRRWFGACGVWSGLPSLRNSLLAMFRVEAAAHHRKRTSMGVTDRLCNKGAGLLPSVSSRSSHFGPVRYAGRGFCHCASSISRQAHRVSVKVVTFCPCLIHIWTRASRLNTARRSAPLPFFSRATACSNSHVRVRSRQPWARTPERPRHVRGNYVQSVEQRCIAHPSV